MLTCDGLDDFERWLARQNHQTHPPDQAESDGSPGFQRVALAASEQRPPYPMVPVVMYGVITEKACRRGPRPGGWIAVAAVPPSPVDSRIPYSSEFPFKHCVHQSAGQETLVDPGCKLCIQWLQVLCLLLTAVPDTLLDPLSSSLYIDQ